MKVGDADDIKAAHEPESNCLYCAVQTEVARQSSADSNGRQISVC